MDFNDSPLLQLPHVRPGVFHQKKSKIYPFIVVDIYSDYIYVYIHMFDIYLEYLYYDIYIYIAHMYIYICLISI